MIHAVLFLLMKMEGLLEQSSHHQIDLEETVSKEWKSREKESMIIV